MDSAPGRRKINMNTSNNSNDGLKPVVVDFQNYVGKKIGFKRSCKGCSYPFKPKTADYIKCVYS